MKNNTLKFALFLLGINLLFTSCKKDPEEIIKEKVKEEFLQNVQSGILVVNEGGFQANNGSISHIADNGTVTNNLFYDVNGVTVGDVVQSMAIGANNVYISANYSGKIEVADKTTFKSVTTISAVSPRHCIYDGSSTVYVSDWGGYNQPGLVYVIDESTNTSTSVSVGVSPEKMQIVTDELWVTNGGSSGSDYDTTISIIDRTTNSLETTIGVGINPIDLVVDKNGDVWVLCTGHTVWNSDYTAIETESAASIYKINGTTKAIELTFSILSDSSATQHPNHIEINPDKDGLYILSDWGTLYSMAITATSESDLTAVSLSDSPTAPYGFNVHPVNGNLYICDAVDYSSAGNVYEFDNSGSLLNTYSVGINPNGVVFND